MSPDPRISKIEINVEGMIFYVYAKHDYLTEVVSLWHKWLEDLNHAEEDTLSVKGFGNDLERAGIEASMLMRLIRSIMIMRYEP